MKFLFKLTYGLLFLILHLCNTDSLFAQEDEYVDWRDKMKLLVYSPRYFGPNAFRLPDLHSGRLGTRWEFEVRGEYHYYTGDQTKNLFARLYIPIANGKAGVEIRGVAVETYLMDDATRDERHAAENQPPFTCMGDFIISSYYQILQSDTWCDIIVSGNLKTTSGNRLCDARYTDAAAYWFEMTAGRNLLQTADKSIAFRLQGMIGFYCWMTNDMVHRQNDAVLYGFGSSLNIKNLSLAANWTGFHGYLNNGDRPMIFRTKLNYEYKKNILSLRYNHGVRDFLYDTYSVGLIRCF
jgi:hypothetical protein